MVELNGRIHGERLPTLFNHEPVSVTHKSFTVVVPRIMENIGFIIEILLFCEPSDRYTLR